MKKTITLLLTFYMLFGLCFAITSCKNNNKGDEQNPNNSTETEGNENTDSSDDSNGSSGDVNTDNNDDNNNDSDGAGSRNELCSEHSYTNNICSVCGTSLWSGEADTSWYSVINMEFTITTAEQFAGLIDIVNNGSDLEGVKIKLLNHIDMNSKPISPLGATADYPFAGEFDGNGYSISNVAINTETLILSESQLYSDGIYSSAYAGLFGYSNGTISNIDLKNLNVSITTNNIYTLYVGGIAGYTETDVQNCSVLGTVYIASTRGVKIGGIVADARECKIVKCTSDVILKADIDCVDYSGPSIGGIASYARECTIEECSSKGNIVITTQNSDNNVWSGEAHAGGLIGYTYDSNVSNCYSAMDVTAEAYLCNTVYAGGLIGKMEKGKIYACYSIGNTHVNATDYAYAGSFIGYIETGYFSSVVSKISIRDCFSVGNSDCQSTREKGYSASFGYAYNDVVIKNCYYASSQTVSSDNVAKTGAPANVTDLTNIAFYTSRMPWNSEIWNITDGAYPTLK